MKQILLAAAILFSAPALAQGDHKAALQSVFPVFDTTWNHDAKAALGTKLELIARKWPAEWITHYYVAYSKAQLAYNEREITTIDALLDQGEEQLAEAVRLLGKETDETHVLRALLANARIGADAQNRWQKWGKVFDAELDKARELNPANPRIYVLRGITKFYTPKMFGGGKKVAKPYFEKAQTLFAEARPANITEPSWGLRSTQWFLAQIEGKEEE